MSLANLVKSAATLANRIKEGMKSFLLKEDGFYLLQETGDKIILEDSVIPINASKTSSSLINTAKISA